LQETFGEQTATTRQHFTFRPMFRQFKLSVSPSAEDFPLGGSQWLPAQHHTSVLGTTPQRHSADWEY